MRGDDPVSGAASVPCLVLDGSEISSVPLRGASDDAVMCSLGGDGSSCVQPACPLLLHPSTSGGGTRTHEVHTNHSAVCVWRLVAAHSVCGASVPHIQQPASLSHCLGHHWKGGWGRVEGDNKYTLLGLVEPGDNPGEAST